MGARRDSIPPIQVHAEENRLCEKREALERERHSDDCTGVAHEGWTFAEWPVLLGRTEMVTEECDLWLLASGHSLFDETLTLPAWTLSSSPIACARYSARRARKQRGCSMSTLAPSTCSLRSSTIPRAMAGPCHRWLVSCSTYWGSIERECTRCSSGRFFAARCRRPKISSPTPHERRQCSSSRWPRPACRKRPRWTRSTCSSRSCARSVVSPRRFYSILALRSIRQGRSWRGSPNAVVGDR